MEHRFKLAALFMLSVALIAFELSIMRVFAVGNWSNFGNLVISTALLGFGLSGAVLTFLEKSVQKHGDTWLFVSSLAFVLTMPLAQILAQQVPFEVTLLGSDPAQIGWIGVYYIVYGVPFVAGSLFIGAMFIILNTKVRQLYFWNMAGSGVGGLVVIVIMYLLPPSQLVVPVMVLALSANVLVMLRHDSLGQIVAGAREFAVSALCAIAAFVLILAAGQIRVSDYKPISYAKKYPELIQRHYSFSPDGVFDVFQSSYFHFAPGLSDNASLHPEAVPNQAFWALYVDGSGPIGIMGQLQAQHAQYVDYLPMSAPYELKRSPKVLLVNLGGGINAQVAKYKGASEMTVIEHDPEVIKLLRDDPEVSAFTGRFLSDPRVHLEQAEARAWCAANPGKYDLVDISLVDSIGLSDSGGYAVKENYTYTKEAINEYLKGLNTEGILSISVWNNLSPPRNVLRLMSTIVQALKDKGVAHPERRIFMFDQLRSTATILVKNSDFRDDEIMQLRTFVSRNSFNMIYYPGIVPTAKDLYTLVSAYRTRLESKTADVDSDFTPSDIYQLSLFEMFAGNSAKLQSAYIFDIRPMSDDRPYYSGYLKLGDLGLYLNNIKEISEEWGYLLLLGVLAQAIVFGLLVILVPILGRWKTVFVRSKGKFRVILYFASLGLSYMLVEVFLMQRLVLFLSNPIFAASIVICAMLIISGLGNLASSRISKNRAVRVRVAVIGIILSLAFYVFALPSILDALQNLALALRIIIAVVLIAPAAFFMGMPYPNGLEALTEKRPKLLPWAWGMNGGLSVAGTALAWIVSLAGGFTVLLSIVALLYVLVAIIFPVNEISDTAEA